MDSFVQRFSDIIKGKLCGFDRIVFKGSFRHLMFAKGVASFLSSKGVLNKNYKDWMMTQSQTVIRSAQALACGARCLHCIPVAPASGSVQPTVIPAQLPKLRDLTLLFS